MRMMVLAEKENEGITLTETQRTARRSRLTAIVLGLAALVIIFYST